MSDFFYSFIHSNDIELIIGEYFRETIHKKQNSTVSNKNNLIYTRYLSCTGSRGGAGSCKRTEKPGLQPEEDTKFTSTDL